MRENTGKKMERVFEEEKLTRKWKHYSKFVAIVLIATSGVLCSLGLVDSMNTREIIEDPVIDEPIRVIFPLDRFTRSFQDFSAVFLGKIETRVFMQLTHLEFESNSSVSLSFLLLRKKTIEVIENLTLSLELLFQLKDAGGGISLEAAGNPGEFELWLTETGDFLRGILEFNLFVYARVFSPGIEYLSSAFSLLLAGITLFLFGFTDCRTEQVFFAICGLSGMPLVGLLIRSTTTLYSYFYLPYFGAIVLLFLVCLTLVLKSFSFDVFRPS